jgi:hypothetical protein
MASRFTKYLFVRNLATNYENHLLTCFWRNELSPLAITFVSAHGNINAIS